MTLQNLGNIGEFVGAIAVVTSLLYLALQIRQNTNSVLGSVENEDARSGTSDAILTPVWPDTDESHPA